MQNMNKSLTKPLYTGRQIRTISESSDDLFKYFNLTQFLSKYFCIDK